MVRDEQIDYFGVLINPWTMEETVAEIEHRVEDKRFTQQVSVNVAKLVNMQRNDQLRNAVLSCDIINADGIGIVWGARLLGIDIPERVAGIDLFLRLLALASDRREGIFLLGAKPEVTEQAVHNLLQRFPKLHVVGWHHGYFWDDEERVVDEIGRSGATYLFVGITSPKKEQFVDRHREQLGVTFTMGVGGSFDILAEVTKRAPMWMQRMGLEWCFRVIQEPKRMWKRYLTTNTAYLWMLIREKIRR